MKVKENNGKIKNYVIEVKPAKQTKNLKNQRDKLKDTFVKHLNMQEIKQNGKWQKNFVLIVNGEFKVVTEKELGI